MFTPTRCLVLIATTAVVSLPSPAHAQAQKPAHPLVQPYTGSELGAPPQVVAFEEYELLIGKMKASAPLPAKRLEGKVTSFYYTSPKGRSALELYRNYEAAFKQAGFEIIFACKGPECGDYRAVKGVHYVPYNDDAWYFAARRATPESEIHAAVNVEGPWTYFVIVEGKPMDTGMAKVTAEALGKDIMSAGHVAVYDILFDTAKADLKTESMAALEQIAAMLGKNPSLALYVVGHTDNVGPLAQNIDLSKRRAEAVVAALTTKYKIAATRLKADGVGPLAPVASNDAETGRAKNRRVELVKQ